MNPKDADGNILQAGDTVEVVEVYQGTERIKNLKITCVSGDKVGFDTDIYGQHYAWRFRKVQAPKAKVKVGDVLKYVEDPPRLDMTPGKVYEVTRVYEYPDSGFDPDVDVDDDVGDSQSLDIKCFQRVTTVDATAPEEDIIKVGDKVEFLGDGGDDPWMTKGEVYKVEEMHAGEIAVIDNDGDTVAYGKECFRKVPDAEPPPTEPDDTDTLSKIYDDIEKVINEKTYDADFYAVKEHLRKARSSIDKAIDAVFVVRGRHEMRDRKSKS